MGDMIWRRLIPLIAVLVLAPGPDAWAGPPTDQLRTYTDQVLKILQNPSMTLPDRREAVRHLAEEVFDVTETAKRALGQHWQQRTPAEQDEFVKLFANLLEQTYISRIDEFGGEKLTYVSEQIDGDRAIVRAKITTKNGTDVPVESRVLLKGNRWLIYDILIENLSLISNYRAQFDRVIRTASYDELVKRLKTKGEFLKEKEPKAPRKGDPSKN
jgi:phospholipid transport system substrate-binding protein